MHKFTFKVCRERTESTDMTIEANSIEEAQEKALQLAPDKTDWQDDGADCEPYLPDESNYTEEDEDGVEIVRPACAHVGDGFGVIATTCEQCGNQCVDTRDVDGVEGSVR